MVAARIGAAEQPHLSAQGDPAPSELSGVVCQAQLGIAEEPGAATPARQHVVHRRGHDSIVGVAGACHPQPVSQRTCRKRRLSAALREEWAAC